MTDTKNTIKYLLAHRNKILRKLPQVHRKGDTEKVERYMEAIQHLTKVIEGMKADLREE
jgi:hypothetical protein